jgi:hypothetical protein
LSPDPISKASLGLAVLRVAVVVALYSADVVADNVSAGAESVATAVKSGAAALADALGGTTGGSRSAEDDSFTGGGGESGGGGAQSDGPTGREACEPTMELHLHYGADWSDDQIAQADRKVDYLNSLAESGELFKTPSVRGSESARALAEAAGIDICDTCDADHKQDAALGGDHKADNLWSLDATVNRSLGAQIGGQLRGYEYGTVVLRVTISPPGEDDDEDEEDDRDDCERIEDARSRNGDDGW